MTMNLWLLHLASRKLYILCWWLLVWYACIEYMHVVVFRIVMFWLYLQNNYKPLFKLPYILATFFKQKRVQIFFWKALKALRKASKEGYSSLLAHCNTTLNSIAVNFPSLPCTENSATLQHLPKDHFSFNLIPTDIHQPLIQLYCGGDGNCLFRWD